MEDINMTRKLRTYTEEFKEDSVALALKSESICQTAKDLDIPEATLYSWVKNKTDTTNAGLTTENQLNIYEELKRLRKENASLKEDREILKKAVS